MSSFTPTSSAYWLLQRRYLDLSETRVFMKGFLCFLPEKLKSGLRGKNSFQTSRCRAKCRVPAKFNQLTAPAWVCQLSLRWFTTLNPDDMPPARITRIPMRVGNTCKLPAKTHFVFRLQSSYQACSCSDCNGHTCTFDRSVESSGSPEVVDANVEQLVRVAEVCVRREGHQVLPCQQLAKLVLGPPLVRTPRRKNAC